MATKTDFDSLYKRNHTGAKNFSGNLHLRIEKKAGESRITEQYCSPPFHLSKPYWDTNILITKVMGVSPGLLEEDETLLHIDLAKDSRLLINTPTALRIHKSREKDAIQKQVFRLNDSAWFDYFPELLIPQKNSRLQQETKIYTQDDSGLLYCEMWAPGRVAHAEKFEFSKLHNQINLYKNEELIYRENFVLKQGDKSLCAWKDLFESPYLCTILYMSQNKELSTEEIDEINQLQNKENYLGISKIALNTYLIRIISINSIEIRKKTQQVREKLYLHEKQSMPTLRNL